MLTPEQVATVRRIRKEGAAAADIAAATGHEVEQVKRACFAMRMPHAGRGRGTANMTVQAWQLVHRERRPSEPVWQTFDRLVAKVLKRRREA